MDWLSILFITLGVLCVFGIGYLGYYLYKKAKASTKDLNSKAAAVLGITKRYALAHTYTVISPASIAKEGKFADLDLIMVGYFGVLCVKCIGLGGEIYGNSADAMWLQVANNKRNPFENPLIVGQRDARVVRDTLFAAGLKSVPVEVCVVCTNKKAMLALPRTTGHYSLKDYKRYLQKEKFEQDKGLDIPKTVQAISKWISK